MINIISKVGIIYYLWGQYCACKCPSTIYQVQGHLPAQSWLSAISIRGLILSHLPSSTALMAWWRVAWRFQLKSLLNIYCMVHVSNILCLILYPLPPASDLRDNIALSSMGGACSDGTGSCGDAIDGKTTTHVAITASMVITLDLGAIYSVSAVRLRLAGSSTAGVVTIAGLNAADASVGTAEVRWNLITREDWCHQHIVA